MPSSMASQHRLSLPLASEEGSELQGRRAEKPPFVEFILSREWGREISHGFRANTGKGSFSFDNVMPSPSFSPDPQSTPFFLFLSFFFFLFESLPWVWVSHGLSWRTSLIPCPYFCRCHATRYDGRGTRRIENRRRSLYFCSTAENLCCTWARACSIRRPVLSLYAFETGPTGSDVLRPGVIHDPLNPLFILLWENIRRRIFVGDRWSIYRVRSCSFVASIRRYPFDFIRRWEWRGAMNRLQRCSVFLMIYILRYLGCQNFNCSLHNMSLYNMALVYATERCIVLCIRRKSNVLTRDLS